MAILSNELKFKLSGGSANNSGNSSIGGVISANDAPVTLNDLFDQVSAAESAAGDTEYRCIYLQNNSGSDTAINAEVWIAVNTANANNDIAIGLGSSSINGIEQTVADESSAPSSVTFSSADGEENALSIGNIPAGEHKALWIRRNVTAGGSAASDTATITFRCETTA